MAEAATESVRTLEFGGWNLLKTEGGIVPATRYSSSVTILEDTLYLFGGASSSEDDGTTYRRDLLSLNLENTPLEWKNVEQTGDIPSAREGASLSVVGDKIYLFGGIDEENSPACAEGLFSFTPATGAWERLSTTGNAPKTQSASSVIYENKLIIFGGILKGKAQNSVHFLDLSTLEWTETTPSGTQPPPRCDHGAAMVGGKMFVTTGSGSDDLWFNDVYALDLASSNWSKKDEKATFIPRDYASLNSIANMYLILFGGYSGAEGEEKCFSDIHYMDLFSDEFQWKLVSSSGEAHPPSRYGHSSAIYKNKLFVLCGQSMDEEFNDVWVTPITVPVVGFEPTPVPRVRYTTSTPIPIPRKIITPAPPQTPKPRDLEELRGNYIKRINEMFDMLVERFQQLDIGNSTLESERAAFDAERKAHSELYERQQQELDEMLKNHRKQNETWVSRIRDELDNERRELALEKAAAEQASLNLAKEQEAFQQKSKKLDAIMRQVQGLKD